MNDRRSLHITVATRVATVAGRDVRYQVAGQGEPVVLIHGLAGSTRWWVRNIPALVDRYTVYLVDLPGFGMLRRFPQRLPLREVATWLGLWLDALGLKRVRLVGHSMGGALALSLAAERPETVTHLALAAPAVLPASRAPLYRNLLPMVEALPAMSPTFLPILAYDVLRAGPRTLMRSGRELLRLDLQADLTRVSAPTLLVWGQRDTLVPLSLAPLLRQSLPHAELVILEGAGHVAMYDRPQAFNAALLAFFADQPVREGVR